jgi:DNA-binding transcriptional ArsR family regulator
VTDASAVFRATGDTTRRAMLDMLRVRERTVTELAEPFKMSQPAVSQHLKVLREADLVRVKKAGRQRVYSIHSTPLREIYDWVEHYRKFWDRRLDTLGAYLDNQQKQEKKEKRK